MIPRLFEAGTTTFDNYGICPLADAIACEVTAERNGEYTLTMEYKRDGMWSEELSVGRIILATPYDNASMPEPFDIIKIGYDISENIVVECEHISYRLNNVIVGKNEQDPGTRYPAHFWEVENRYLLTGTNPFTFETDIEDENGTVYKYGCDVPTSMRSLIGGSERSMLALYGGELEWNRYKVILHASRGSDNGVKIAYSKNLTGLNYSADLTNAITGVIAYWKDNEDYIEGSLQSVTSTFGFNRVAVVDASSEFDEKPTASALNAYASDYLAHHSHLPDVSVEIEFVPLWQTEEYKDFYDLEHVGLCDIVTVDYPPLNLELSSQVVKTIYDVLADRYKMITISSLRKSLADTIYTLMKEISS